MAKEKIKKGLVTAQRKIMEVGNSKAVTIPSKWFDIHKWFTGEDAEEFSLIANEDFLIIVPYDNEEKALELLEATEKNESSKNESGDD